MRSPEGDLRPRNKKCGRIVNPSRNVSQMQNVLFGQLPELTQADGFADSADGVDENQILVGDRPYCNVV